MAGLHWYRLLIPVCVQVSALGNAFEDTKHNSLPGSICLSIYWQNRNSHDSSPYTDSHGRCLYVESLVFIKLFLNIQQYGSFGKVHFHRRGCLFEFHAAFFVQRDDLAVIEADRSAAFYPGHKGLAAVKPEILHDKTRFFFLVKYLYISFITQQAHGGCSIAVIRPYSRKSNAGKRE